MPADSSRSESARTFPGGLLRFEPESGATRRYDVPEVIVSIERLAGDLFLATSNGVYVLMEDRLRRYFFEPGLNDELEVILSDYLP